MINKKKTFFIDLSQQKEYKMRGYAKCSIEFFKKKK